MNGKHNRSEKVLSTGESAGVPTPQEIGAETRDAKAARVARNRLVPRAILVGALAGGISVAFRMTLGFLENYRTDQLLEMNSLLLRFSVIATVSALATGCSLMLVRKWSPEAAGSGISHLRVVLAHKGELLRLRTVNWLMLILVKFFGGLLAIGSGLALGREGPTVQMGGAAGNMVWRIMGSNPVERGVLIAAGGGAGLAAAFNAPLAGVVFVLEEVQHAFTPRIFFAALLASITSDAISRFALGQLPVFHTELQSIPSLSFLPMFVVLGCLAGVLGSAFNRCLLKSLVLFDRFKCIVWM